MPTEEELARAKSNLVASSIFERDSQASMARLYGASRARGESLESIMNWNDVMETVTAEQVREVLAKYVKGQPSITTKLLEPES